MLYCFLSLHLFLSDFASTFSFIILLLVSYGLVGAEGTCGALGALSCFILFLLWLLFLSIRSSMYSVKKNKLFSAHSSSFKSTFRYLFIAALRPLRIVSWCSSIVRGHHSPPPITPASSNSPRYIPPHKRPNHRQLLETRP